LPPRDTPGVATANPRNPASLSRTAAEAAWHAVTPSIAGSPQVRVSRDGGRTYPALHARPLPADPPGQPCTMPVYDSGAGTGRVPALDLDPGRGRGIRDATAQVGAQAEAIAGLVTRVSGRCVTDVSPRSGRHVYVLFAAALPWRELRDPARALSLRFPAIDPAPVSSLGGQISAPGARHKSGGWRVLSTSLEDARPAVGHPNGPEVWDALLAELAAELRPSSPWNLLVTSRMVPRAPEALATQPPDGAGMNEKCDRCGPRSARRKRVIRWRRSLPAARIIRALPTRTSRRRGMVRPGWPLAVRS
jgi:hypothetical protein